MTVHGHLHHISFRGTVSIAARRIYSIGVSRIILKDRIRHCVVDAVENQDRETIEELNKAIDHLFK